MRKIFTTLGCALALAAFALPANAEDVTFGGSVTLGGSGETSCNITTGSDVVDHYISMVSNNSEDVSSDIKVFMDYQGMFTINYSVEAVKISDGNYAYNIMSESGDSQSFAEDKSITFEYTGSTAIQFTVTEGYQTAANEPDPIEIVLDKPFTLGGEDGNKAYYFDQGTFQEGTGDDGTGDGGYTSESYPVYLVTNSKTDLDSENLLSITVNGHNVLANDWVAVVNTQGYYAYNGTINQNTRYDFNYKGDGEVTFTLGKGVYTEYGAPTEMEEEAAVTYPLDGNQYVLSLNEMRFTWADINIAAVPQGVDGVPGQVNIFVDTDNIENSEDAKKSSFSLTYYDPFSQSAPEGDSGIGVLDDATDTDNDSDADVEKYNSIVVDLSVYTMVEDTEEPVPGVYTVVIPAQLVVDTETGAQNKTQSFTVNLLPGMEGEGSYQNGAGVESLESFEVIFAGNSIKDSGNNGQITLNGNRAAVQLSETGASVTFPNLEDMTGTLQFNIPEAMFIITVNNEDGTTTEYLNEEFNCAIVITGPDPIEGVVSPVDNTAFPTDADVIITVTFDEDIEAGTEGILLMPADQSDVVAEYDWSDANQKVLSVDGKVLTINLGEFGENYSYYLAIREGVVMAKSNGAPSAGIDYYFKVDSSVGVNSINVENGSDVIYNLRGVKVNNPAKGEIHIINGKKVVVK